MRGGGGIVPDVPLPLPAHLPAWFSVAADSGFDDAIADSVAQLLPVTPVGRSVWLADSLQWRVRLVAPFLDRVRHRLGVAAQTDAALEARLARILGARAADVRWGRDALDEFVVQNSSDVRAAVATFPRLKTLLAGPSH